MSRQAWAWAWVWVGALVCGLVCGPAVAGSYSCVDERGYLVISPQPCAPGAGAAPAAAPTEAPMEAQALALAAAVESDLRALVAEGRALDRAGAGCGSAMRGLLARAEAARNLANGLPLGAARARLLNAAGHARGCGTCVSSALDDCLMAESELAALAPGADADALARETAQRLEQARAGREQAAAREQARARAAAGIESADALVQASVERAVAMRALVRLAGYQCGTIAGLRPCLWGCDWSLSCDGRRAVYALTEQGGRWGIEPQ